MNEVTTCDDPDCGEAEHYIVTEADADCSAKEEFSDRG